MAQPPKRKHSIAAWKEFEAKLTKYVGPDQPTEFAYAIREVMARATSGNGLDDDYVKEIGKKYFIKGEDQKRLLELKQKWDKFNKELGKLHDDPGREATQKWNSPEMQTLRKISGAISSEFKHQFKTIKSGELGGLREFQLGVHEKLNTKARKKALEKKDGNLITRQIRESDRQQAIEDMQGISDHIKGILKNNYHIDGTAAKSIQGTFNHMMESHHLKKLEFRRRFTQQVAKDTGVKLSRFEFDEIWNAAQNRIANSSRAAIESVEIKQPLDLKTKNYDYRKLRIALADTRKILADKKTRHNNFHLDKFENLYRGISQLRKLDNVHLKALFGTNSTKTAKRLRDKLVKKLANRVAEAKEHKLLAKTTVETFKVFKDGRVPTKPVRPMGADYRDKKIKEVDKIVKKLKIPEYDKDDKKQAKRYEQLQKEIEKFKQEYANWRIDNVGERSDWRAKKEEKTRSFELYVHEEIFNELATELRDLNKKYGLADAVSMVASVKEKPVVAKEEKLESEERKTILEMVEGMSSTLKKQMENPDLPAEVHADIVRFNAEAFAWVNGNKSAPVQFLRDQSVIIMREYQDILRAISEFESSQKVAPIQEEEIKVAPAPVKTPIVEEQVKEVEKVEPVVVAKPEEEKEDVTHAAIVNDFVSKLEAMIVDVENKYSKLGNASITDKLQAQKKQIDTAVEKIALNQLDLIKGLNHSSTPEMLDKQLKEFKAKCDSALSMMADFQQRGESLAKQEAAASLLQEKQKSRDHYVSKYNTTLNDIEQKLQDIKLLPGFNSQAQTYKEVESWLKAEREFIRDKKDNLEATVTHELGDRIAAQNSGPNTKLAILEKFEAGLLLAPKTAPTQPAATGSTSSIFAEFKENGDALKGKPVQAEEAAKAAADSSMTQPAVKPEIAPDAVKKDDLGPEQDQLHPKM